ncbi:O-antigen ligase family protein [Brasilonema sp. UFV-L1]|uniref:O-antigen ligase family protein n=1 Tax=Brasilonema sp. UFV-L1 TaxID=2234130 RepID=UPI00145C8E1B|nr:O-antigen ligase family protein [Brasilonema sp. UFV-L1]NMG08831.1 hypothetical protein [Brasilonema sp. UFV-L1]
MKSFESIWLAMGIVLTTATQLRLSSLPLGPGEMILFLWIIFVIIRLLVLGSFSRTHILQVTLCFWLIAFTSMTFGLLIAELMGVKASDFQYDYSAFILAFLFSSSCTISENFSKNIQKIILYSLSFSMVCLFIIFCFPSLTPFLESWYGGIRFAGWAKNPNQLALLLCMIPFLALYLFNKSSSFFKKIFYATLSIMCVIIGLSTGSDALMLAWAIGFTIITLFVTVQVTTNIFVIKNLTTYLRLVYKLIIGLIILLLAVIVLKIGYDTLYLASADVYDKGGQGSERVTLWTNGIAALSHSPLFGLGPGSHSGENGPFLDFEAHNTFIDWGASSGIIGLIAYIALLGWVAWTAWHKGFVVLFAAVISLAGFSCFHYVLRHPIFWFYLLAIANLSKQSSKTSTALAEFKIQNMSCGHASPKGGAAQTRKRRVPDSVPYAYPGRARGGTP